MKKINALMMSLFLAMTINLSGIDDAQAKRFGGARSFGGKPSYSTPYRKPTGSSQRSTSQQQAYQKNQVTRQTMLRRGGIMGMLGGLALGGLLGAMFFGGAFEGLNFMDILVFGGIAYLLYKLMAGKARPNAAYENNYQNENQQHNNGINKPYQRHADNDAGFDTDVLFKKSSSTGATADSETPLQGVETPEGFDCPAFLQQAESMFRQLQKAWDAKDLAEIRGLTSDHVFAEIQQQIKADPGNNYTEVLKIEAQLVDYREMALDIEVTVLFDTLIKEEIGASAKQIREIWHFIKPRNGVYSAWHLDGIQQMEY